MNRATEFMPRCSRQRRWLGAIPLVISLAAALVLSLEQLVGLTLRGCGPDSGCASLAAGPWGSVLGWPVSYLGLAYFSGLALAWLVSTGGPSSLLRWIVRCGAMASAGFLGVMVSEGHFCPYCLAAHLGNFAFWAITETTPTTRPASWRPVAALAGSFAAVSLALGVARSQVELEVARQAQAETKAAVDAIVSQSGQAQPEQGGVPFTGRWRQGPEVSPIRLVVWGDYQCKDCWNSEDELHAFMDGRTDVSVSFLHFPLCKDCNRTIKHPKFHDNACRAADAAETAGFLAGNHGFWKMHNWLFEHKGTFTDDDLRTALPQLGFDDAGRFFEVMESPETRRRVEADIEEAVALGVDSTPFVFINGVELKSADVAGNLTAALKQLAKHDLPASPPTVDRPQGSLDRLVARWSDQEKITFPELSTAHSLGATDAAHELTLVMDYANPYSVDLNRLAESILRKNPGVRYRVIQFPLSKELNSRFAKWETDFYGQSAPMARLAAAVAALHGEQAFWDIHRWILDNQSVFTLDSALAAVADAGYDEAAVQERMSSHEVQEALKGEIASLEAAGITWASSLYLDGKKITAFVPTDELVDRLLSLH